MRLNRRTRAVGLAAILLAAAPRLLHASPAAPPEAPEPASYPSLKIGGFSDFNFFANDSKSRTEPTSGFQEGQFVLHFTSELAPRLSFFGEVTLSARSSEFRVEVERSILRYDLSDYLKLSAGRYPVFRW